MRYLVDRTTHEQIDQTRLGSVHHSNMQYLVHRQRHAKRRQADLFFLALFYRQRLARIDLQIYQDLGLFEEKIQYTLADKI